MDILIGEKCRQFRFVTLTLFIGQFVYPVGGKEMGVKGFDWVYRYFSQLRASLSTRKSGATS